MPSSCPAWPPLSVGRPSVSLRALCWSALLLPALGCGSEHPYSISPVSGKLVTSKPIAADRIIVTFIPQAPEVKGVVSVGAAQGEVNPQTGDFKSLTTLKGGDGASVGRHKVTVVAVKNSPEGVPMPIPAIPAKYQNAKTTPLEFEVKSGSNFFELPIESK